MQPARDQLTSSAQPATQAAGPAIPEHLGPATPTPGAHLPTQPLRGSPSLPRSVDLCCSAAHTELPPDCISGSHLHGNTHHPRAGLLCSANLRPVPSSLAARLGRGDTHAPAQAKTRCSLVHLLPPPRARGVVGGGAVHGCVCAPQARVLKAPTPHPAPVCGARGPPAMPHCVLCVSSVWVHI